MHYINRREFLQTSAVLIGASVLLPSFGSPKKDWPLSFSTLGCPDWSFPQIVSFAAAHGYKGIEVRGLQRQMNLPVSPVFNSAENIKATMQLMKENDLHFIGLGSSATLHFAEGEERQKNLEEARQFIDLAEKIKCPYVRVFPNKFPKEQEKQVTIDLIVKGLIELGEYAKKKNVTVLLETHGDVVWTADLEKIMMATRHTHVGLVWDISNMWTVTNEPVREVYEKLKKYIRHTHIKDARLADDKLVYTLLGRGEVPILEAISILNNGGYRGYYSFEWEKMWHPGIEEPEIALADYPRVMKKLRQEL